VSLTDRFQQLRGDGKPLAKEPRQSTPYADAFQAPPAPTTLSKIQEAKTAEAAASAVVALDMPQTAAVASEALGALKERASQALYERLGSRITDSSLEEAELHQFVRDELKIVVDEEQVPLSVAERQRLIREIIDDVLGHGPIQRFLDDPSITVVMVNRFDQVYVERQGRHFLTDTKISTQEALRRVI
jgi:hypothetical protein